jgi:hypothetical protein
MQTFKLDLTLNELNVVLQALGNLPFTTVFEVIAKIKKQGEEQLQSKENEGING